jgi:hypothetical protein
MAFIGPAGDTIQGVRGDNILECVGPGLGLGPNAGPFAIVAPDSGRLTTDTTTTPANETPLLTTAWGPGEGNWTANDLAAVTVLVYEATGPGADVRFVAKNLVGGNVTFDFWSIGIAPVAVMVIRLIYEHSVIR